MGCDIHAVIERRSNAYGEHYEWLNSGDPDIGRNYEMFAALAGVRNRNGIVPVAEPRGLPAFKEWRGDDGDERWISFDHDADTEPPCWEMREMAERYGFDGHSHSWLTLAEMKAYDTDQVICDSRVVIGRDAGGAITGVAAASSHHTEQVGEAKILRWPGEEEPTCWLRLIRYMEQAKWDGQSDEEVRLVFFFDN